MLQNWIHALHMPTLLVVGIMTFSGLYFGKMIKTIKLPSIIGFMLAGVLLGPSPVSYTHLRAHET